MHIRIKNYVECDGFYFLIVECNDIELGIETPVLGAQEIIEATKKEYEIIEEKQLTIARLNKYIGQELAWQERKDNS
jgi:hypothetical protein